MSEQAERLIKENIEKHRRGEDASYLDLGKCGLTEMPDVSGLHWIETLILSTSWYEMDGNVSYASENKGPSNDFSGGFYCSLPDSLKKLVVYGCKINNIELQNYLPNLTSVNLSQNHITSYDFLQKAPNINWLRLYSNQISDARFLEKLSGLTTLDLRDNQISDARFLEKLSGLTTLDLRKNKISDAIFLEKLSGLTTLNLSSNQISDARFLEKLSGLTTLDLSGNKISDYSFLEKLSGLTTLNLSDNKISDARFLEKLTGLTKIDISKNQIQDFSPLMHLVREKNMEVVWKESYKTRDGEINVKDNPFTVPPREIVEQGNEAILNYFKQIEEQGGTAPLYEAKLIIVGEPAAGKTTLFQILKNPQHQVPNAQDKSTTGVKVEEGWRFSHPKLPQGIEFAANLWDFGGQEIQYMTHQFFLTARSLYVILTDDRRENANMAYWFSAADLFGRDDGGRQSPILVALNSKEFKSASKFDFDLHRFQHDYEHLQIEERRFDFATEGGYGRTDLVDKIKEMLVSLPHVGDQLPRRWPDVREALRERGKQVNHIDEAEFCRICTDKGISRREDQFYLSRYLHDLGSILHFQTDPELRDFIILNPSWAVAAVYSVLENKTVVDAEGLFDDAFLDKVWGEYYSRPEQSNLLRLMKRDRFEVCFELPGERGKYLAPQLLSPSRPAFNWPKTGLLKFHFQYQFLPKGIVTRLHVRKHEMVAKDKNGKRLAWDKGAVFHLDGCRAVVEERELKDRRKIIEISAEGPIKDRLFLLKMLRKEIEAIHDKWFSKVTFEQMVPCNCEDCFTKEEPNFYELKELLKYERKNVKHIKCSKSEDLLEVSVSGLLDGIFFNEELLEFRENIARKSGGEYHYHGTTYVLGDQSTIEQMADNHKEEKNKQGDIHIHGDNYGPVGGEQTFGDVTTQVPAKDAPQQQQNTSKMDIKNSPAIIGAAALIVGFVVWYMFNSDKKSSLEVNKDGGKLTVESPEATTNTKAIPIPTTYTVQVPIKINGETPNASQIGSMRPTHAPLKTAEINAGGLFLFRELDIPKDKILIFELLYKDGRSAGTAQAEFVQPNQNGVSVLNTVQFYGELDKRRNQYINIRVDPKFEVKQSTTVGDGNKTTQ